MRNVLQAFARPCAAMVLAAMLVPLGGCVVAAAAAVGAAAVGVVYYDNQEARMDFKDTLPATFDACVRALRLQGYEVRGNPQPGAIDGLIEAPPARVVVESHPGGYVRVRVRVGTFGSEDNERRAKLLVQTITEEMPRLR
jgi:hypothetical protein